MNHGTRSKIVAIRMSPRNLKAAQIVAQLTCRSVSSLAEYALLLYIEKNYPDAFKPGAKVRVVLDGAPEEGE
jgi:hypothetical protein